MKNKQLSNKTDEQRFLEKIVIMEDGCWHWNALRDKNGYGKFSIKGKSIRSHRFAYQTWIGPIPNKMLVCHKCDCPPCVNPEHLFLGTEKDNANDMCSKNRQHRMIGSINPQSKLTENMVREIKLELKNNYNGLLGILAKKYNVNKTVIHKIKDGLIWKHVV